MLKDAFYFSHDSNAKDDPKCVMLIEQLGLEGYGIFWVLIETLREQPGYKYPMVLIPALARRFNTTAEKMKAVVCSYDLFVVDDNEFFSLSLMERMKKLDAKREQARDAVNRRWEKQKALPQPKDDLCVSNTDVLREYCEPNTSKVNKSKVNKSKVKDNSAFLQSFEKLWNLYPNNIGRGKVNMKSLEEIIKKHGLDKIERCIERYKKCKPDWQAWQNGSTFFNSGYVDYLADEFVPPKESKKQEQHNNFDQRSYDDVDFEQFYTKI